jgi:hypothetical protein
MMDVRFHEKWYLFEISRVILRAWRETALLAQINSASILLPSSSETRHLRPL